MSTSPNLWFRYDSRIILEPERNKVFKKLPELPIINNNARILSMGAIMNFSQTRPGVSNRIPFEGEGFTFIGTVILPVLLMAAPLNLSMTTLLLHTFAHFTGPSGILYAQGQ